MRKNLKPPKAQEFGAVKATVPDHGRVLWLKEYHGGLDGYAGFEGVLTSDQIRYFVSRGWIGMFLEPADEDAQRIIAHWQKELG